MFWSWDTDCLTIFAYGKIVAVFLSCMVYGLYIEHTIRFLGEIEQFFGYGIVTIEMFEKKMFQIMCHMIHVVYGWFFDRRDIYG